MNGYLNSKMIVESENQWTPAKEPNMSFRFYRGFLYRKVTGPHLYAGYQIHRAVAGSNAAKAWIELYGVG